MTNQTDPYAHFTAEEKARLIAAAPALLMACNSIMCSCEEMDLEIGSLEEVRDAIALYEGKPYVSSV